MGEGGGVGTDGRGGSAAGPSSSVCTLVVRVCALVDLSMGVRYVWVARRHCLREARRRPWVGSSVVAVLITPPPIPTGLWESSRIPTGFLLGFNKVSGKAFSHIFSFPFLLDSYWTPMGLQVDSN